MSTLRVSNIEAKADASSPTIDEKVKVTSSQGRVLVQIDGKTAGITSIGINTTGTSFTIDRNQNVQFAGIITAANLNTTGVTTFSSGIIVSAGSTAAPSISPSGDSNTGIFFPSPDTVCIGEGGTEVIRVGSAGSVGIGTNDPKTKFHIENSTGIGKSTYLTVSQLKTYGFGTGTAERAGINLTICESSVPVDTRTFAVIETGTEDEASSTNSFISISNRKNGVVTERIRLNSDGYLRVINQPVFSAFRSGNLTGVNCTAGNTSVVVYNATNVNIGNCYSTSTGLFTAPVAGRYFFSAGASVITTTIEELWWIINGGRNVTPQNSPSSVTPKGQDILYLQAGDTVGFHLYDSGGDTNATVEQNSFHTFFKGCLIC